MSESQTTTVSQKLTFMLPSELHAELSKVASDERRSLSGMTRLLLEEALIARSAIAHEAEAA